MDKYFHALFYVLFGPIVYLCTLVALIVFIGVAFLWKAFASDGRYPQSA